MESSCTTFRASSPSQPSYSSAHISPCSTAAWPARLSRWWRQPKRQPRLWPAASRGTVKEESMAAPFKSPQSLGFSGLALSGALAATLLISACSGGATPEQSTQRQAPTIPVTAAHVERGTIEQSLAYSGDIRASGQVTVFAKGTGRVERVLVDVGSRVSAADKLADLDSDSASIQLMQA